MSTQQSARDVKHAYLIGQDIADSICLPSCCEPVITTSHCHRQPYSGEGAVAHHYFGAQHLRHNVQQCVAVSAVPVLAKLLGTLPYRRWQHDRPRQLAATACIVGAGRPAAGDALCAHQPERISEPFW